MIDNHIFIKSMITKGAAYLSPELSVLIERVEIFSSANTLRSNPHLFVLKSEATPIKLFSINRPK